MNGFYFELFKLITGNLILKLHVVETSNFGQNILVLDLCKLIFISEKIIAILLLQTRVGRTNGNESVRGSVKLILKSVDSVYSSGFTDSNQGRVPVILAV